MVYLTPIPTLLFEFELRRADCAEHLELDWPISIQDYCWYTSIAHFWTSFTTFDLHPCNIIRCAVLLFFQIYHDCNIYIASESRENSVCEIGSCPVSSLTYCLFRITCGTQTIFTEKTRCFHGLKQTFLPSGSLLPRKQTDSKTCPSSPMDLVIDDKLASVPDVWATKPVFVWGTN